MIDGGLSKAYGGDCVSVVFDDDFGAFALARAEDNGRFCAGDIRG